MFVWNCKSVIFGFDYVYNGKCFEVSLLKVLIIISVINIIWVGMSVDIVVDW